MRNRSAFFVVLLALSACGGASDTVTSCETGFWNGQIGLCVSEEWRVLDRPELDERGVSAEAIIAFQSERPYAGQFATIVVTQEPLAQPMTMREYSDASVASVTGLPEYAAIDSRNVTIDGSSIVLHIFSAKPRPEALTERFYQLSAASQSTGYTVTGATPVSVDPALEKEIIAMLSSVTFVPPDEEEQTEQ